MKKKKNNIILIITISMITSISACKTSKIINENSLYGTYMNTKRKINYILEIKKDNTFQYREIRDSIEKHTYGNWYKFEDCIILNSDPNLQHGIILHATEQYIPDSDSISIKVLNEYDEPLSFARIEIIRKYPYNFSKNNEYITLFDAKKWSGNNIIRIHWKNHIFDYQLKNRNTNVIILKLKLNSNFIFFKNMAWKIHQNLLTKTTCNGILVLKKIK